MKRLLLLATLALTSLAGQAAGLVAIQLEVDAREISRKLVHAREEIPVPAGKIALWYLKWIPGTHSPGGPLHNVAGMRLETPDGKPVPWRRDESEIYRIEATIPPQVDRLVIRLDYICNQSTVNSEGVDNFGNTRLGVIDWNTCLLYPESSTIDDLRVSARLLLPANWKIGTALAPRGKQEGSIEFEPETLRDLVDKPVICGEFLRTVEVRGKDMPTGYLHLVSESAAAVQIDENYAKKYGTLLGEAGQLYGGAHFKEYHWLVTCSDEVGESGVEHLSCSMNGVKERDLVDEKRRKNWWISTLMPHEFSHSWCGKHRRPAGMVTQNFHTPEQTSLLWVYEGLDEYLGEVLAVRAGLMATNDYIAFLAWSIDGLMHKAGRLWRPLEDTAIASYVLRAPSKNWNELRRDQDYYFEGRLLWFEADAIIREKTDNAKSLDDFCRKFMGPSRTEKIVPYNRAEIVSTLKECADYDWDTFIRERVETTQPALPLSVVERLGYRMQYSAKSGEMLQDIERELHLVSLVDSVGLLLGDGDGRVQAVIPGGAADKAGMAPGMQVAGVNGRKFSADRAREAVADSLTKRHVELLILDGDTYRTITIPYADGSKYLELVRNPDKPDLLAKILAPKLSP
ncbi:MAG TPA: hypothetical protein VHH73_06475 [Verrucomicrobiae bacterium]|nr:hypothetical protein [Verrucomicrobiae bacterium]